MTRPNLYGCPDCGREVSLRAEFCPGCGGPLRRAEGKARTLRGWKVIEGTSLVCLFSGVPFALAADSAWFFAPSLMGLAGFILARMGMWWGREV